MTEWLTIPALKSGDFPVPFGEYLLLGPLGAGGFAQVYRAEKCGVAGFRKTIAIKLIRQDVLQKSQHKSAQELVWEARVGGLLHHRHIVDTIGFGDVDGQPYIALEWVEGLSLKELLALGAFPPSIACEVAAAIASALAYAHSLRLGEDTICLVHRDVKPGNILVGWDGSIKLSDFGIAWLEHSGSGVGERACAGTPQYMAPEQAAGGRAQASSDLFSLGLVLYEMLAGQPVWAGSMDELSESRQDIDTSFLQDALAALSVESAPLHPVISQCLRADPTDRYPSASALLNALKDAQASLPNRVDLDAWLAATLDAAEPVQLGVDASQVHAPVSDSLSLDQAPADALGAVLEPLRAFGSREAMIEAAFSLEQQVQQMPLGQRGDVREACVSAMAAGGWECVRGGSIPALLVDPVKGILWWEGERIATFRVRSMAFRLVLTIAERGETLDREALFEAIWEQPYSPPASDNALYVRMHRIRDKLKNTALVFEAGESYAYILKGKPAVYLWRGEPVEVCLSSPADSPAGSALPNASTPFFGRSRELAFLRQWHGDQGRLLFLSGPPGVGKSRLAETFAQEVAEHSSAWWCDLSNAGDSEALLGAVAEAAGVPLTAPGNSRALSNRLGQALADRGGGLLILDGCDGVRDALADALPGWFQQGPALQVLLTGNRPLGVATEQRMVLGGFEVRNDAVDAEHPAMALFVDRARHHLPDFSLSEDNHNTVRQIVRELEGLPLAIELAAARIGAQSVEQIRRGLTRPHDTGSLKEPERALQLALETAWQKLMPYEKSALSQLTVFSGGFTVDFAESVVDLTGFSDAPWPMDVISDLYDRSLLHATDGPDGPRFRMCGTIHRFASNHREDAQGARDRHADAYAAFADRYAHLHSDRPDAWIQGLHRELDNLMGALEWRLRHPSEAAVFQLCRAIATYFYTRGPYGAGLRTLKRVTRQGGLSPQQTLALRVLEQGLLDASGRRAQVQGEIEGLIREAHTLKEGGLELQLRQLHIHLLRDQGDVSQAVQEAEAGLRSARSMGDERMQTRLLVDLGTLYGRQGQFELAEETSLQALTRSERHHHRALEADCWLHLGQVSQYQGRMDEADSRYARAEELYTQQHAIVRIGRVSAHRGQLDLEAGRLEQAEERLLAALTLFQRVGSRPDSALPHAILGRLSAARGKPDTAREHYQRASELLRDAARPTLLGRVQVELGQILHGQGEMQVAQEALENGEQLLRASQHAGELVRGLTCLGEGALLRGESDAAECYLQEAETRIASLQFGAEAPIACALAALRSAVDMGPLPGARPT